THLRGRRWLGRESLVGTGIRADPSRSRWMAATQLDCPLRDRRTRERREAGEGSRLRQVRRRARCRHDSATAECRAPRRDQRRRRGGASWLRRSPLRPARRHTLGPRQPDCGAGRRRAAPALSGTQVMRPLRYSINVTLDGCCDHRVMIADEDVHRHAVENLNQADGLLFGRVTYEMMEAAWRSPRTGAMPDWTEPFARTIDAAKK